jgi:hypothetical protein
MGHLNDNMRSHCIMFQALFIGLVSGGQLVYVVGFLPQKKPIPEFRDISVECLLPAVSNNVSVTFAIVSGNYFKIMEFFF